MTAYTARQCVGFLVGFVGALLWHTSCGVHAQTAQPDATRALGSARVLVDLFSPAQAIRVEGLPRDTTDACTLFASLDETMDGQPYVPRHCWFSEDFEGGYSEDWDFIPTGHVYDITVEYEAAGQAFRTPPVRVARVAYAR